MKRMMPPSKTKPMDPDASFFERAMRVHLINDERPRRRIYSRSKWDSVVYGGMILLFLTLLGIFGDI